jgi:hypothetical protein
MYQSFNSMKTKKYPSCLSQQGASLIEFSLSVTVVIALMLATFDLVRIGYTKSMVRVGLTEALKKSQGDLNLKANVWSLPAEDAEVQKFMIARLAVVNEGLARVEPRLFNDVKLIPVNHFDSTQSGETVFKSNVAYLPPGYSAYIADWETPIHNPNKCAPDHKSEKSDNLEDALFRSCSGSRVRSNGDTLKSLSERYPTVMAAFIEMDTIFFGHQKLNVQVAGYSPIESFFEIEATATPIPVDPGQSCVPGGSMPGRMCELKYFYKRGTTFGFLDFDINFVGTTSNPQLVSEVRNFYKKQGVQGVDEAFDTNDDIVFRENDICFKTSLAPNSNKLYECKENVTSCAFDCARAFTGCFDKDTPILLEGNKTKKIQDIKAGDKIVDLATRKATLIKHLISGSEKDPLIELTSNSTTIRITQKHPVITKRGLIQARKLEVSDKILGSDGNFHKIELLRELRVQKGQMVYNLELDNESLNPRDRLITTGSLVTPDIKIQQMLEKLTEQP